MDTTQKQYQALIEAAGDSSRFIAELFRYKVTQFRDHRIDKKTFENLNIKMNKKMKKSNLYAFRGMSAAETQCFLCYYNIDGNCISDANTGFTIALVNKNDIGKIEQSIKDMKSNPSIFEEIIKQASLVDQEEIILTDGVEDAYEESGKDEKEFDDETDVDRNDDFAGTEEFDEESLDEEVPDEKLINLDEENHGAPKKAEYKGTQIEDDFANDQSLEKEISESNESETLNNKEGASEDEISSYTDIQEKEFCKDQNEINVERVDKNSALQQIKRDSELEDSSINDALIRNNESTIECVGQTNSNTSHSQNETIFSDTEKSFSENDSNKISPSGEQGMLYTSDNETFTKQQYNEDVRINRSAKKTEDQNTDNSSDYCEGSNVYLEKDIVKRNDASKNNDGFSLDKSGECTAYSQNTKDSGEKKSASCATHTRLADEQTYEKEKEERKLMDARQAEKREQAYKIESKTIGTGSVIPVYAGTEQLSKESMKANAIRNMMSATTLSETSERSNRGITTNFQMLDNLKDTRIENASRAEKNALQYNEQKSSQGNINFHNSNLSGVSSSTTASSERKLDSGNLSDKRKVHSQADDYQEKQNRDFDINRLLLRHVSAKDIFNNPLEAAGKFIVAANTEDYRESMVGQKRATFTGISAYTSNRAFKAVMDQKENALFIKLNKRMKSGKQEFATLNSLLKARGYSTLDFMGKQAGRTSMESIYLLLRNSGLASLRDGRWDLTKFERLMKKCEKSKNFDSMIRALGLSDNNTYENTLIINNINELTKKTKIQREAEISKKKSGKSFRSLVANKIGKDTAVMNGFMESKKNLQTIYSTYRAARMVTILNAKGIGKAVRFVANRKVFDGTKFQAGVNKIDTSIKDIREKKLAKRDERAKRKQHRKEKVRSIPKRATHKAKERIYAIMPRRLQRVTLKFSRIGKKATALLKKVNPLKLIGLEKLLMAKIKKYVIIGIAAVVGFFLQISLITGGMAILTQSITTFLTGSEEDDDDDDFFKTPGGKAVMNLQLAEYSWANSLLNKTSEIDYFFKYSVRYGRNYEAPETYLPSRGMQYHDGTNPYITGNPFYFELDEETKEAISKKIYNIDGGVELHYEDGQGGTSRTSNIKDIMSMSSVYFQHSEEAEDNFPDVDSVMDDSGSFSLSGLAYCLSNKVVSSIEKKKTSGVLWDYCQALFNLSHQEVIDLNYVILPTSLNYEELQNQDIIDAAQNVVNVTFCPDGDKGGCTTYDNFFYCNNAICIKDAEGNLRDVSGQVTPTDENYEPLADGDSDDCNFSDIESLIKKLQAHNDCFIINSQISYGCDKTLTERELENEYDSSPSSYSADERIIDEFLSENGCPFNARTAQLSALVDENGSIYGLNISFRDFVVHDINPDPTNPRVFLYSGHEDNYTIKIIHECRGHHFGRFCGGHLKADITGIVYGFTEEQIREDNPVINGKIKDGEYIPQKVRKNQITPIGSSEINDIFDIDMHIRHTSEMEDWAGWTADNMELAIQKYNSDWQELYGIDFATSLGGTSLTISDIEKIVALIKDAYPNVSQSRIDVIRRGLGYVGNIGYSQAHHNCLLDGPCGHGTGVKCGLSDCSGFASNLWYDRLGYIYSTASFYTTFHPSLFSNGTQPGDILLHYGGQIADGVDDHALIWLGYFDFDGDGTVEGWSIDCSTVNGVGNVFFRTRNYYTDCYVVSPE